jgi:precorrin-3B synthase
MSSESLAGLSEVATHGDGNIHLTRRANVQLRGLPSQDGALPELVLEAIEGTGLLPSRSHELVRNFLASPMTGLAGGRCDLRPVVEALDGLVCARPDLAELPGRFLFVMDDGRGDLVDRPTDLGVVALDATSVQLRTGSDGWGPVLPLGEAAQALVDLAVEFVRRRGDGPAAPWHVDELPEPLTAPEPRDERTRVTSGPLPYGENGPVVHVPVPDGVMSPGLVADLVPRGPELVVTPWHGVLVDGGGSA